MPKATPSRFYELIERTLAEMDFSAQVWALCRPAYAEEKKGGRPGIDPVVYLKMLMVGFFEDLPSERAIAARCADSLSVRGFLGYELCAATPDHSSFTVIRQRLGLEIYQQVFELILRALRAHGLLQGRHLGIDSSVLEANASLRSLCERNTEESYWQYVQRLAAEAGVDPEDFEAVRRFDKKRPGRKVSNQQWFNPHEPEAKISKTKRGATAMLYKPEHMVDLETGAIVAAAVLPGDQSDTAQLSERVVAAGVTLAVVMPEQAPEKLVQSATADKGYFALEAISQLQHLGIRTVISDPQRGQRRLERLSQEERAVLERARRASRSESGKSLLRQRGQHLERSFAHVLDAGGLRRATLRGGLNLTKRYQLGAAFYNLSQLLRKVHGIGTARQWLAMGRKRLGLLFACCKELLAHLLAARGAGGAWPNSSALRRLFFSSDFGFLPTHSDRVISTVC
ncbi:MAG: transposase [Acidobacteria bacterium]|nr:transposase [Acidobacteriota bacterium]